MQCFKSKIKEIISKKREYYLFQDKFISEKLDLKDEEANESNLLRLISIII